jgi:sulfotransferase famil protein
MVTEDALRAYYRGQRFGNRLLSLPDYGCTYVKNPKAACSTLTLWLHRIHLGDPAAQIRGGIHSNHRVPTADDIGWDEVARLLSGDGVRFTFVRHPVSRAESVYREKLLVHGVRRVAVQRILGLPEDPESVPTVDQFVAALEAEEPLVMDPHWRPQYLNLLHGLVEYDVVGQLETFDVDLARVRELAGLPDVPVERVNVTPSTRSGNVFDDRPDLMRRVEAIYAMDFELYGY